MTSQYRIIHSDLLKYLKDYQAVAKAGYMPKYHAVLCDPPYGIDFMAKGWDKYTPKAYQAWVTEWATMMLDFVYPGGVLMAFGGTRTYHRLVCGLEDAGWEIGDEIDVDTYTLPPYMSWVFGSGFPKSHNLSKAIDKAAGAEREVVGKVHEKYNVNNGTTFGGDDLRANHWNDLTAPATPEAALWEGYGSALKPAHEMIVIARKPRGKLTYAECALRFGSGGFNIDGGRIGVSEKDKNHRQETGGITNKGDEPSHIFGKMLYNRTRPENLSSLGRWPANTILVHHPDCNGACHADCHVKVMGEQSGESVSNIGHRDPNGTMGYHGGASGTNYKLDGHNDSGNASRFFYQAKASNWERNAGISGGEISGGEISGGGGTNHPKADAYQARKSDRQNPHPTVKPIQLTQYLATLLLTPVADSRILIPFSGVGSEMIGAFLAKWNHVVGIEMTDEYIPIAEARLKWWSQFDSYEAAQKASGYEKEATKIAEEKVASGQMSLFDALDDEPIVANNKRRMKFRNPKKLKIRKNYPISVLLARWSKPNSIEFRNLFEMPPNMGVVERDEDGFMMKIGI